MSITMVCTDMDGTLFARAGEIPEINVRALQACEKKGIKVALVSGRANAFLIRVAKKLGVNCAIVSANGARIEASPQGPTIFEGTFQKEEGEKVLNAMLRANVYFEAYTREVNYIARMELIPEIHKRSLKLHRENNDTILETDLEKMKAFAPANAYKFVAFTRAPEEYERVRREVEAVGLRHCSSGACNLEVMPEGVGKGGAVRRLNEYFGLDAKDTMAFGDFTNDIEMLEASGHPVAMGNAVSAVKDIAEIIAPNNDMGGVGQVLFEKVLGDGE